MAEIYVKGPVLSPGLVGRPELGLEDRPLTPQEIQKAAYNYLPGSSIVDVQHNMMKQAEVVESYIASDETQFNGQTYPPGTWFMTSKVTDPELQNSIHKGELKGFSVGAFPENLIPKGLFKDVKEGEWFALAVSIVKMPYYPEMIFKVFKPDEFIKKSIKEVKTMTDEDKSVYGLFTKMFDYFVNKEANILEIEPVVEAPTLTLEDVNMEVQNVKEQLSKLQTPEPVTEPEPEPEPEEVKAEEQEAEPEPEETIEAEAEPEEPEDPEPEEKIIKKSIDIDEQKPASRKGYMEELGRDAFGRKL
jgi:hypothetical protein